MSKNFSRHTLQLEKAQFNTKSTVLISLFSALAFILMNFEISIPIFPSFLKIDISEIPVIFSTLSLGPIAGIITELLKNVLHLTRTSTNGVGELANFLVGCFFILPIGLLRQQFIKSIKQACLVMILSIISLVVGSVIINAYITLPLYEIFVGLPLPAIIGMSNKVIPLITDKLTLLIFAFAPFNLIKGIILTIIVLLSYKSILPQINRLFTK